MIQSIIVIIGILIIYVFTYIIPIERRKKQSIFLLLVFIYFFGILIFRKPFSDMITYCDYYVFFGTMSWKELLQSSWEKGYLILNKILYIINPNQHFFIIATSFLTLIGPYFYIKKYSKNYFLSVSLFVALGFFSYYYYVLRQMLALSILLFSIKYIKERKLVKFMLLVILATLFHTSSFAFIILYFISNLNVNKKYYIMVFTAIIGVFLSKNLILNILNRFMNQEYIGVRTTDGYMLLIIMIIILISLFALEFIKKYNKCKERELYNQYVIAVMLQVLATSQSIIARLVVDFFIATIILIPNSIEQLQKREKIAVYGIVYIAIIGLCLLENTKTIEPYVFSLM